MTLSESAINEILAALERGDGTDLVRQLAEFGIQGLTIVRAIRDGAFNRIDLACARCGLEYSLWNQRA